MFYVSDLLSLFVPVGLPHVDENSAQEPLTGPIGCLQQGLVSVARSGNILPSYSRVPVGEIVAIPCPCDGAGLQCAIALAA